MMKQLFILLAVSVVTIGGCTDMGNAVAPVQATPTITSVSPDSAALGDTVAIEGIHFGLTQGTSVVSFGGVAADTIYRWSDTAIQLKVPASALSGSITVTVGGTASNAAAFVVRGTLVAAVSFLNDVLPVFQSKGCTGCHGGTNNLYVDSYAHLMLGTSLHGPVVTPGNGEQSVIIKKLRGTAGFGVRMPDGGPYLDDATIAKISLWITQGALNN